MREAIRLAGQAKSEVEPNPPVGAVVVGANGDVVGRGFHRFYGGPHAEVEALMAAGVAARGATLYVTLEPCSTHGKTPPCCEAVIESGISRVVCAIVDPNPAHAGAGIEGLRSRGIAVELGVAGDEAEGLLSRFRSHLGSQRPWVIAKWAMSMDGRIATRSGDSKWISCEASRAAVHTLRGRVDAIAVGVGTVKADDPRLTARPPGARSPARVVFDDRLEVPDSWGAFHDDVSSGRPWIIHHESASPKRASTLDGLGARRFAVSSGPRADAIPEALRALRKEGVNRILVEGGGGLLGSFVDAGCVDQWMVFVAPTILGGAGSPGPVGGVGALSVASAPRLQDQRILQVGSDLLITGFTE